MFKKEDNHMNKALVPIIFVFLSIIPLQAADLILIDTIPNYITMVGNKCISAKKVPGDIFKQPLTFGSYAVFERKGNNYELKQKWDDEDAEPGREHEGVVMAAKFPYIRTIIDPEFEGNLDIGLAESYRNGNNLDNYWMIGKDRDSYALYAKKFITPDGKREFLVTGLLLYSDYITVVIDKWQKKDNIKLLSYSSEVFRKLSGQILAANNNDLLSFYVLEGIVKQPETALKRKVWFESDEALKLKKRFDQDKAKLFSTRYIVLITTPTSEFLNNPLLKWNFSNQYDLNAESFKFSFAGDLSLGLLDLESAFPIKWDIPRGNQLTEDGRKEMNEDLAQVFKEMGFASKQVENEIEYYDAETQKDARQYIYTSMTLGAYDQIRRIKSKYRQPRTGILEIKASAKEAEKIDGNNDLHIALVFDVTPEAMVDPYSGDSLFKCKDGEIRILDRKTLGRLFALSFKQ